MTLTDEQAQKLIDEVRQFYATLRMVWRRLDDAKLLSKDETELMWATKDCVNRVMFSSNQFYPYRGNCVLTDKEQAEEWESFDAVELYEAQK